MDNELECPLCNGEYSQENVPRLLTVCGHTFCHECLETLIVEEDDDTYRLQCPEDQNVVRLQNNDIAQLPKNIALLKLVDAKRSHISGESFKDESLEITKIAKQDHSRGNESEADILSEIVEGEESKLKNEKDGQGEGGSALLNEPQICLVHQKPLDIVDLVDMQRICSKCAIFGDHRGHQFRSLEQIEQECNGFKDDLLQIERQKEVIGQSGRKSKNTGKMRKILNKSCRSLKQEKKDSTRILQSATGS